MTAETRCPARTDHGWANGLCGAAKISTAEAPNEGTMTSAACGPATAPVIRITRPMLMTPPSVATICSLRWWLLAGKPKKCLRRWNRTNRVLLIQKCSVMSRSEAA